MSTIKLSDKNKDFFHSVYAVARLIPAGKVTSYGAIALYLGVKSGARMVGWAMNNAGNQEDAVPAHRVVNRNGRLTGKHHFHPPEKMQQLLEIEGVEVSNDQVMGFEKCFWDPRLELGDQ
jgi:methylated-DNA-protein-cysteine methyltransferase-like protein